MPTPPTAASIKKPDTPPGLAIVAGVGIGLVGMAFVGLNSSSEPGSVLLLLFGLLLSSIGGTLAAIGIVAAGVQLGTRWIDYERSLRS
jgi:type IV secretory pathway VirB2 component (pilin)